MHEKRRHFRKIIAYPVKFSAADGRRADGTCHDFSLGGIAIETDSPAAFGAKVTVYMQLAGMSGESALEGIVRWNKDGIMGVQWSPMGARHTYALTEMLATTRDS